MKICDKNFQVKKEMIQWLLVSHNTTGLKNVLIPVGIENANIRVNQILT